MCRVLDQTTEARLHITELALDHPERVLDLRPYLRLGFFDLALGFVQIAALAQFLVGAASGGNLPDDLATFMLGAFLHSGIGVRPRPKVRHNALRLLPATTPS